MDTFQAIDSSDSRYGMKQKDIAATVRRMGEVTARQRRAWEDKLGDELVAATEEAVLKGGVNCVGSTAAYRRNFDNWASSLQGTHK